MKRDAIDLSTQNVFVLFRKFFLPTLFGMLSISAVTAIDGVFVGHGVGSDGIAAINIAVPIFMVLTGVGLMIGAGCSVVASIQLARGKEKAARLNVTQAMLSGMLIALVPTVLILSFPQATARLLGASPHLMSMVVDYLVWLAPAFVFQVWEAIGLFIVRLDGSPRLAMLCSVVAAVVNAVLDWLFIFPFGWGLMGAALASSLAMVVGGVMVVAYIGFFARRLRFYPLKRSWKSFRLSLRNIGYQCRIGSSALLGEATIAMLMFVGNQVFMHWLGDDGVGAFGIACYYIPFVFMVGNAIAQSAQPIISYNFGLGKSVRVADATHISLATALFCGLFVTALFVLFPEFLVSLFVRLEGNAAQIAVKGFPYFSTGFTFFIINLTAIGYFQSVERVRTATVFALLRGCFFLVPCFVLLPHVLGNVGIWMALSLSEALTSAGLLLRWGWVKMYGKTE